MDDPPTLEIMRRIIPYLKSGNQIETWAVEHGRLLFRGLTNHELEQLVRDGPDRFQLQWGKKWSPDPAETPLEWARRHGTHIVVGTYWDNGYFTRSNTKIILWEECTADVVVKVDAYCAPTIK